MKGMLTVFPGASYDLKSFATDAARNNIAAYPVFHATHTGPAQPMAFSAIPESFV